MRERDAPFTMRIEGGEGAVTIVADGELDRSTAPSIAAALEQHRGEDIVIDLSAVGFADSSMVRTLVEERHHAHLDDRRFAIKGASDRVRRSFELSGVEGLFDWV